MRAHPILKTGSLLALAVAITACGGGSSGGGNSPAPENNNPGSPTTTSGFTVSAIWEVGLPASGDSVCYDIDTQSEADCDSNGWDLKLKSGGRTGTLWTNGGTSATDSTSKGAALGSPFTYQWTDLQAWTSATRAPGDVEDIPSVAWFADGMKNVFTGTNSIGTAAFEYGIDGSYLLYPTFRTFVITTDSSKAHTNSDNADGTQVFALQLTGYYGGASGTTSGYVSFRFAEKIDATDFGVVQDVGPLNASTSWVYYDLIHSTVVDVPSADNWHIAFNRYNVKLNQGEVGTGGTVGGFLGKTPDGFYDGEGKPVVSAFTSTTAGAGTLADLTASNLALPAAANGWVKDSFNSLLNPASTGSYPNPLNYGWYTYYSSAALGAAVGLGAAHMIKANPENATLLRSSAGNSYARFHLKEINYADNTNYNSAQTWVFELDIQPAP